MTCIVCCVIIGYKSCSIGTKNKVESLVSYLKNNQIIAFFLKMHVDHEIIAKSFE
jgi:hypothetical protein